MTRFIFKNTGRVYIAIEHTVGEDIVYGRIDKNGHPYGKTRSFLKDKIKYVEDLVCKECGSNDFDQDDNVKRCIDCYTIH